MLYIIAIVLGIAAGIAAGGKLSNLLNARFEKTWVIIAALAVQILARILGSKGFETITANSLIIQGVVFCLLLAGFWFNRHFFGVLTIGAGSVLNALVMMANGGKMPVSGDLMAEMKLSEAADALRAGLDSRHALIDESTRLAFLSDIISPPGFLGFLMRVISIGDLVVIAGLLILVFELIKGTDRKKEDKERKYSLK